MFIRYNAIAKIWEYDSTSLVDDPDARVGDGKAPWLPLPISYSQIHNPPTIPPAYVLPANVAKTDVNNNFVAQTLGAGTEIKASSGPNFLIFNTAGAATTNKIWRIINYGDTLLRFERLNDAGSAILYTSYFDASGFVVDGRLAVVSHISERSRAIPMGEWQDVVFNPADFIVGAGTWTINAIQANRYTLIGKTIIWSLSIADSSLSVATDAVFVKMPGGFSVPATINMGSSRAGLVVAGGTFPPITLVSTVGGNTLRILNLGSTFPAGALSLYLTFTGEIA